MRLLVLFLAVGLIPPFVAWQQHHFDTELRPGLEDAVQHVLAAPEFQAVRARLDHLDVSLSGTVADFALRHRAAASVDALPGVRVRTLDNRIQVTPELRAERGQGADEIHGRLHPDDRLALRVLIERLPTPEAPAFHVQGHPSIQPLAPRQRRVLLAGLAEFMPLPGPRSMRLDGDRIELHGALTLQRLAELWEQAGAGPDLERLLYQATLYPSVYHLPGYRPESSLDADTLAGVRALLAANQPRFADGSTALAGEQQARLQTLADGLRQSAGRARFVIGGHVDRAAADRLQSGIELGRQRAGAVRDALVGLGLDAELFEVVEFGPTSLAGEPPGPSADSVEILLK